VIYLAAVCVVQCALIAAFVFDRRLERREVAAERRGLLLRIHAPQTAAAMDYNRAADDNPPAVDMSDTQMGDDSHWLSREQLAEAAAEQELNGRG
jgi:hypothetical protein